MKIEEMMNTSIVTVKMDDSLGKVKKVFDKVKFHHLPVVEQGELFGIISDRDLLKAISPNVGTLSEKPSDVATLHKKAHQILTRKPITLLPTAGVYDAIDIFNLHSISCIPVVDKDNVLVGVVSWRDVLKVIGALRKKKSAK